MASDYTVTLAAEPTSLETGEATTLTTHANRDLTGTRYTTYVFDQADPSWYRACKVESCSFSETHETAGTHTYVAYIARERSDPQNPPTQVRAASNTVSVTWSAPTFTVSLSADRTWLPPGSTATLTAEANRDVGPRGYVIQVYDLASGERVAACASGTVCSTFVTQVSPATRTYQAFVARDASTAPPPDVRASSGVVTITWSVLPDPSRPPNIGAGPINGTVTFPESGVPPLGAPCADTSFVFDGRSDSAWVNGSGASYVGPVRISADGGATCETASTGTGGLSVSAEGASASGTLSCPSLEGTFTRVGTHVAITVTGDCVISGFAAFRVSFLASGEFVPANEGGGTTVPVTKADFVGAFTVAPG